MDGAQLFGKWNFHMANEGVEADEWDDLSPAEQASWNKLAEEIVVKQASE